MIRVHVPATSANLGPGFDSLGLALDFEGIFDFEIIESGIHIYGCEEAYQTRDNLVYQAFLKTTKVLGKEVPGISIGIHCDLPMQRGLGSSAACIVAGVMGANALFHNRLNKYEIFDICTALEGHPDNIAPALFGQLTVAFIDEDKPNMIRFGVHPDLRFLALIPEHGIPTAKARELLPNTLSYQDAISQIGRSAAMCKAIEIGNGVIMRKACKDFMHEPYRKQLIEEYETIYELQKKAGAFTMFISGSGSTMLVVSDDEEVLTNILHQVRKQYPSIQGKLLKVHRHGAFCEVL